MNYFHLMGVNLKLFFNVQNLFLLFLFLCYTQSIENIQTIILYNETATIDSLNAPSYLNISFDTESNIPNYIKIQVEHKKKTENEVSPKCVISFYQNDANFKERKQFSQSVSGKTFIWLNKEQIKNEFYVLIQSSDNSSEYTLNIFLKETAELFLNEQYSYYVSEENQEMNFTINNDISEVVGYNLITLWAKGNKEINTTLDVPDYQQHLKYNAYFFYLKEFKEFQYKFQVYGKVGDIINVGSILFEGENDLISHTLFKGNSEIEITGFIRKEMIETVCYKFEKINQLMEYSSYVIYDNVENLFESNQYKYNGEDYDLKCITFPENVEVDEIFYSIYYIPDNNATGIRNVEDLSSFQINGLNYRKYIKSGETIEILPIMPDLNFGFLTYYVNILKGKAKIELYTCDTYPLCTVDLNNIKDAIKLQDFYSYSYSYTKNDLNDNLLSNVNPEKKIMLITCENENIIEVETETGTEQYKDTCLINANIYKTYDKILISQNYNYHKHSRKYNEDFYLISSQYEGKPIYINIELLSGDITVNMTNEYSYSLYEKNNLKLYIITNYGNNDLMFSIYAKNESLYNIRYYIPEFNSIAPHMAMEGGSYLFTISKDQGEDEGILISNSFEYLESALMNEAYFVGFYPLNSEIKVEYVFLSGSPFNYEPLDKKQGFYQEIFRPKMKRTNSLGYKISKNDNITEDYLFYISIFKYNNETNDDYSGIFLRNNVSQLFAFDKNNSIMKFSYAYTEKNDNNEVNIILKLLDKETYKLNVYINNIESKNVYNIINNETIFIKSKEIINICGNEHQICKISFSLISENNLNESSIEINVNTNSEEKDEPGPPTPPPTPTPPPNNKDNENGKDNNQPNVLLIVIIAVVALIVIIIIVFLILRLKRKKSSNINDEIETIPKDKGNKLLTDTE